MLTLNSRHQPPDGGGVAFYFFATLRHIDRERGKSAARLFANGNAQSHRLGTPVGSLKQRTLQWQLTGTPPRNGLPRRQSVRGRLGVCRFVSSASPYVPVS